MEGSWEFCKAVILLSLICLIAYLACLILGNETAGAIFLLALGGFFGYHKGRQDGWWAGKSLGQSEGKLYGYEVGWHDRGLGKPLDQGLSPLKEEVDRTRSEAPWAPRPG